MASKAYIKQAYAAAQQAAASLRGDADTYRQEASRQKRDYESKIDALEKERIAAAAVVVSEEDTARQDIARQEVSQRTAEKAEYERNVAEVTGTSEQKAQAAESAAGQMDSLAGTLSQILARSDIE